MTGGQGQGKVEDILLPKKSTPLPLSLPLSLPLPLECIRSINAISITDDCIVDKQDVAAYSTSTSTSTVSSSLLPLPPIHFTSDIDIDINVDSDSASLKEDLKIYDGT